jgi:hypothetical protein
LPLSPRIAIEASKIEPAAAATPLTASTRGSKSAARAGGSPPRESSTVSFGLTVTSVRLFALWKMSSNELLIVSVSIRVPAIIATPKKIASAVRLARSLRDARPRRLSDNTAQTACIRASTSSAD